jgi:RimJ/RimL family protein N-acetyltransferase
VLDRLAAGVENLWVADPSSIEMRPLRPEDRDALARLFTELSPRSRYRRFLFIKGELAPRELDRLTAVDHVTHEAIVAVDARDGSLVGVCRYVHDKERPGVAELAIVVVDAWQGMRIGAQLAAQIVQRARDNEMTMMSALTLAHNPPIHALLRSLGFRPVRRPGGGSELNWELILTPLRAVPRGEQ